MNPANSLETNIDLINEIRGVGTVMLLGAIIAFLGIIRVDFRETSFVVVTMIFAGVVLGRSISFFIDGMPNENLIRASIAEIVLSLLNVFCLVSILMQSKSRQ